MAKRTAAAANLEHDPEHTLPSKRTKSEPAAYTPLLLNLPGELRNAIYDYAFSDLHDTPLRPHTRSNSNFSTYRNLQFVSKQIATESKGILISDYIPTLTIHVNNVPRIYELLAVAHHSIPELAAARFRLCARTYLPNGGNLWDISFGIAYFIALQRGRVHCQDNPSYDIKEPMESRGYQHWLSSEVREGITRPLLGQEPDGWEKYGRHGVGDGIDCVLYGYEEEGVEVMQGELGRLVMDNQENIKEMRRLGSGMGSGGWRG